MATQKAMPRRRGYQLRLGEVQARKLMFEISIFETWFVKSSPQQKICCGCLPTNWRRWETGLAVRETSTRPKRFRPAHSQRVDDARTVRRPIRSAVNCKPATIGSDPNAKATGVE
jgi:hypothetical protein